MIAPAVNVQLKIAQVWRARQQSQLVLEQLQRFIDIIEDLELVFETVGISLRTSSLVSRSF